MVAHRRDAPNLGERSDVGQQLSFDDVEIWLPVVGYEDTYQISSLGRVWSKPRFHTKGGILRANPGRAGYLRLSLSVNGVITEG